MKTNTAEPVMDLKWGRNFPVDFVEVDGKIQRLKEFDSKEEATKTGIIYHKFLREVFNNRISQTI